MPASTASTDGHGGRDQNDPSDQPGLTKAMADSVKEIMVAKEWFLD
jgi:hypothetical protein